MKKIYFVLFMLVSNVAAMAQLQNNSFENWSSTSFDEPNNWNTANGDNENNGLTPVTQVQGQSGNAVRMETMVSNGGDTAQAYIANGDPMEGKGGIPISGTPTGITGYYRYNLPNNDSAIFFLSFKQGGNVISQEIFKIKGTGSQNTFTQFSFPVTLGMTPDTVIIAAAASNLIDNVGVEVGSFLEIDGLAFTGISSPIPNNDFESWTTNTVHNIMNWSSYGEGATRTTDSHDGSYAMSLSTIDEGNGNLNSSGITNGYQTQNGPGGGTPFTSMSDTLTGWFKYTSPCSDTGWCYASTMLNGNNIGGNSYYFTQNSQYTYFEIPVSSWSTPDTLRIDFTSSSWPYNNSCGGSTLIVDQLMMKSDIIAGIKEMEDNRSPFAFPNPASSSIHINGGEKLTSDKLVEVYDLAGRLVLREMKKENSDDAINISTLKSGRYYYRLAGVHGESMNSFTKN